ncbi:HAD family phosphatase [Streptomyces sp. VNUA24]|uniref:HAD family hydrolase n=1 Tax=Streptomyces sp. VNUA24 TaxID=3031131 RepID=UPI0023B818C6|nr:HAD family phosphatase [Streptomyces sp. VNUA24]WEH12430.1 HAD family phosphatase [Streptomyces sp. VNUA24]
MTAVIRATVFDLDDTLVDTRHLWPKACAAFTVHHGHRWRAEDTAALHGNGAWADYVAGLGDGTATPDEVTTVCTDSMIIEVEAGHVRALPGAVDLVLEATRYGPVAVATASPRRFVHAALDRTGLTGLLHTVICGEDVTRPKPAPDAYQRAAVALGIPTGECLAVEDSPNGIRSAHAAGMHVLAVARDDTTLPADISALVTAYTDSAIQARPALTRLLSAAARPGLPAEPQPTP